MLRSARVIRVHGVVQGVGFRPFTYRLAHRHALSGWVRNGGEGVEIHVEGAGESIDAFLSGLRTEAPPAAHIATVETVETVAADFHTFEIRESTPGRLTVPISADIATCDACLRELFDPNDRRYRYPYINCTDCGPRYSIVLSLPYDRPATTMAGWTMCSLCRAEYDDPADRRFHAQPIACPACGPAYLFERGDVQARDDAAIVAAADALHAGAIVAVKGIGGYHLACDAANEAAVTALRNRKFRKERPFAIMVRDIDVARSLVMLDEASTTLLTSSARPIVLASKRPATTELMQAIDHAGVAPYNADLGVMLPYAPLHALLFASGAPAALVLTSANRSSEPIAYDDTDARRSLRGIADAFLVGQRPIARRVDDSIARLEDGWPAILRRSRGFAPQSVAALPVNSPILAMGGDLKNAVALVVDGAVIVSQHVGDLTHLSARDACVTTLRDLCAMYAVDPADCLVAHDAHPEYISTAIARELSPRTIAIQHHRAHIAGVIAERAAWSTDVLGLACDGTGYGDDGTIWGGECFAGSVAGGLSRIAHLRPAHLPGGDAAARFPVQAAAGFLVDLEVPDLEAPPFSFPSRYRHARELVRRDVRTFGTTSLGRLFDVAAALCGFVTETTFEGQAAMWLEHIAAEAHVETAYPFPLVDGLLDYRPLLVALLRERAGGQNVAGIARSFHLAVADGLTALSSLRPAWPVVAAGGVFQNRLLCGLLRERIGERLWLGHAVPANDGGLCVGQAALAAFV